MNTVYNIGMNRIFSHAVNMTSGTFKVMLFRDTSTYVPDPDHTTVAAILSGGGVEISVSSYARQTIGSESVAVDNTGNRSVYDGNDMNFGSLETGQNVSAFLVYEDGGTGDDADNKPYFYFDGKTNLDIVGAPGTIPFIASNMSAATKANPCVITTSSAHGLITNDVVYLTGVVGMTQINNIQFQVTVLTTTTFSLIGINSTGYGTYVSGGVVSKCYAQPCKPVYFDLLPGTQVTFSGVTTIITNAVSRKGTVVNLGGYGVAADVPGTGVAQTTMVLPISLGGGSFTITWSTEGIAEMIQKFG